MKPFDEVYPEIFESDAVEYASNSILIKSEKSLTEGTIAQLKEAGIGKAELLFEMEDFNWYTAYLYKDRNIKETMEKSVIFQALSLQNITINMKQQFMMKKQLGMK